MFKLSRKGWNNVIIVVVLIVITLLHRLEQAQQENSAQRSRPLLPEAAVVLTWQGPSWQIERIGQGWRSGPDLGLSSAQLAARIETWQGWLLPPGGAVRGTPVTLKIWIAGCANGEEFYSLAILFREEGLEDRTIFYCTDISPAALEKAEAGIYAIDRLPQFSENHRLAGGKASLSDYYTAAYGAAVFDKTLRRRAVFAQHNLASDQVFGEVQLVSSRNVLIYFDRELQDRALGLFGESLVRGGFLGLGSKETLRFSRYSDGFADFDEGEKIYRRNLQDLKALDHAA